jgi:hypothetical protein
MIDQYACRRSEQDDGDDGDAAEAPQAKGCQSDEQVRKAHLGQEAARCPMRIVTLIRLIPGVIWQIAQSRVNSSSVSQLYRSTAARRMRVRVAAPPPKDCIPRESQMRKKAPRGMDVERGDAGRASGADA